MKAKITPPRMEVKVRAVTFGEIMMRLSTRQARRFEQAGTLDMCFGGSEANVAAALAQFGEDAAFVSKLPSGSLGQAAINSLRSFGVDTSHIRRGKGRLGLYFLEQGAGQRASQVVYDRKGSAFAESDGYDWKRILAGATHFHFSGITPALGAICTQNTLDACRTAKELGIKVSCDLNYRAALWTIDECKAVMRQLAPYIDLMICNEQQQSQILSGLIFPQTAVTKRSGADRFGARLGEYNSREYTVSAIDRIGAGDAFSAGLLYGLDKFDLNYAIEFAAAAAVLKHTIPGDMLIASADDVLDILNGSDGRIKR
jgi:2-dehydro-3-deoxygluconokinase